jgi:hypothetical protein
MADGRIIIGHPAARYDVRVSPPIVDDGLGWEFRDHDQAKRWATILQRRVGFPIVDMGEASNA